MYRPIIQVDLDEVVFDDFMSKIVERYNAKYNDNLKVEDLKDYNPHVTMKSDCENCFYEFVDSNFFMKLNISDDTKRFLNWANKHCNLIFLTAAHPYTIESRHNRLKDEFDWYNGDMLYVAKNKKLVYGDYIIDDCMDNLRGNLATTICVNKPWNTQGSPDYRVNDLTECIDIIEKLEKKRAEEANAI